MRIAAGLAAGGFIIIACFQAALAVGVPWGDAAWGGAAATLPTGLRIASGVAVVFWVFAALIVLGRGGYAFSPVSEKVSRRGSWVLVGLLALGTLMNLASPSNWERFGWAPFVFVNLVLCFIVARGGGEQDEGP